VAAWAAPVPGHQWIYAIGLATAGVTAFYMFRLYYRIFRGKSRVPHDVRERMEDPPGIIIVPLYVLAFFAVVAGFAGLPQVWGDLLWGGIEESNSLAHFLAPVLAAGAPHEIDHSTEYRLAAAAVGVAVAGALAAWWLYMMRRAWPARIQARLSWLHRILSAKFWVDEIYDALLVRPLVAISRVILYRGIDVTLIDGVGVNGLARSVRAIAASGLKYAQSGFAQSYLLLMTLGAAAVVIWLLRPSG
jgi:NADH-quinone oxidoreductase subunit L